MNSELFYLHWSDWTDNEGRDGTIALTAAEFQILKTLEDDLATGTALARHDETQVQKFSGASDMNPAEMVALVKRLLRERRANDVSLRPAELYAAFAAGRIVEYGIY